ncbi:putative short-chain dehydrogenase [Tricladium varicosporioides]|nr:putative short-chain dehydrogenase [Hymenoscyphus varicosporioides]
MTGLVIFTGANSSLGIPAAEHLLSKFPEYTMVFTVRDASISDTNTQKLRDTVSRYPKTKSTILALDLSSLSAVHTFADTIASDIRNDRYPKIAAIVCNAYYWNLVGDPELTADGYDKTFEVSHISHAALTLRLLGSFSSNGRIVFLSSDSHWPGKNPGETYPPGIPSDLNLLVKPTMDADKQGRGYQRYATAKLAITTWMYALNQYLEKDENLQKITAVAINPGNLVDSRALRFNTPKSMILKQKYVYKPFLPLLKLAVGPTLRTAAPAGVDVVNLALSPEYAGERGFFTLLNKDQSSPESQDQKKQASLWAQTLKWAKITKDNTALQTSFD